MQRSLLDLNKKLDFLTMEIVGDEDEDDEDTTKLTPEEESQYLDRGMQLIALNRVLTLVDKLYEDNNYEVLRECKELILEKFRKISKKQTPIFNKKYPRHAPQTFEPGTM